MAILWIGYGKGERRTRVGREKKLAGFANKDAKGTGDERCLHILKSLVERYRQSQIKAAVRVNTVQLLFNLSLGKDIAERQAENKYGSRFYAMLSKDLKSELPYVEGFSESNIRYCKRFYLLYKDAIENLPQLVEELCNIPWGHHRLIIDRCSDNPQKALFFVGQTIENGWSRAMLLN